MDLHRRGFAVEAVDPSAEMVNLARARIREAGMADAAVQVGDAHSLSYEAQSFDLVLALGVVPWLHSPALAISEVVRVLRPARYFLLSSDNPRRLTHLLDPRLMPVLAPVKEAVANVARRLNVWEREGLAGSLVYRELTRLLDAAGFSVEKRASLGFGPSQCSV